MELEYYLNFFYWLPRNGLRCLPQKYCGNKIPVPQSVPGDQPPTKEPEDSLYEIVPIPATLLEKQTGKCPVVETNRSNTPRTGVEKSLFLRFWVYLHCHNIYSGHAKAKNTGVGTNTVGID